MKSKRNGLGLALLALSLSFGGSLVRAEEPASPFENIVSDPLAKVVQTIELRLAGLEATMMAFAGSFSSDHITTRRLCVSDGSGETCITKAQLDALLKLQVQLGQAPATAEQPAVIVGEASAPPVTTATAPAAEPAETVATVATVTMETPKPAAEPAEAVATAAMETPKPATEAAEAVIGGSRHHRQPQTAGRIRIERTRDRHGSGADPPGRGTSARRQPGVGLAGAGAPTSS